MCAPTRPQKNQRTELEIDDAVRADAARCLQCGTPLCRVEGCVLGNPIPEIHDLVSRGHWEEASRRLHTTDNFPEFTGRFCAQSCQVVCAQGHSDEAVPIRQIECHVAERAFAEGWIEPRPASQASGRKVAIAGSGPAALTLAQQLARRGHEVTVDEQDRFPGDALREAAADGDLDSHLIDRRLRQLAREGVIFATSLLLGRDIRAGYLLRQCDALCLTLRTIGRSAPRAPEYVELAAQLDLECNDQGEIVSNDGCTSREQIGRASCRERV